MDKKTTALVSYITLIGWLIAFFTGKDDADDFVKFHFRQSLGLHITSFVFGIVLGIIVSIVPALNFLGLISLVFLVLMILGAMNANKGEKIPLPNYWTIFLRKITKIILLTKKGFRLYPLKPF